MPLALVGIIYHLYPSASENKLAKIHFWLHNIGLPILMVGQVLLESGNLSVEPITGIGALVVSVGILLFVMNVLVHVKASSHQSDHLNKNLTA